MTCSTDLRKRVLGFVAEGGRKIEAARVFRVARSTVFEGRRKGVIMCQASLAPGTRAKMLRNIQDDFPLVFFPV
jgi:hypothetical protein